MKNIITEEMLSRLRARVVSDLSPKRSTHILEVEKMAVRLGKLYIPDKTDLLRSAALLHDITKELDVDAHKKIFEACGISLPNEQFLAPKTLHAISAAALIEKDYPEFADPEIISAVRWHTTAREDMTLSEKLIYLADYIDMSRKFDDCVRLREYFFSKDVEGMSERQRLLHLDKTILMSLDMTVEGLASEGSFISEDTLRARDYFISRTKEI